MSTNHEFIHKITLLLCQICKLVILSIPKSSMINSAAPFTFVICYSQIILIYVKFESNRMWKCECWDQISRIGSVNSLSWISANICILSTEILAVQIFCINWYLVMTISTRWLHLPNSPSRSSILKFVMFIVHQTSIWYSFTVIFMSSY